MSWLWISLALTSQHADPLQASSLLQTWSSTGRIVDGPVHVGLRPAAFCDPEGDGGSIEWGAGWTLQVTADVL